MPRATGFSGLLSTMATASFALTAALALAGTTTYAAEEAQWIWSPAHTRNEVPDTSCYFRRSFVVNQARQVQVAITADDEYELFVNGRRVASGTGPGKLDEHNISQHIRRGTNLVAVRVGNSRGSTAALAARVMVEDRDGRWRSHSTDKTWKTNLTPLPLWSAPIYNDSRWAAAQEFGPIGETAPWDVREEPVVVKEEDPTLQKGRFEIDDEFEVHRLIDSQQIGSLIAMTFNEFGHVLASQEGGPLLLIYDSDEDGRVDKVRPYCELVKNCQGILALNGEVYVTADGPDGHALYRLTDEDRDGRLEQATAIIRFKGSAGEHGAHGVTFGPDGLIYVVLGNHVSPEAEYAPSSPYRNGYEGDLFPRYEDPTGHAAGIKAPGGVVLRTTLDGSRVEAVAGGLRNAYDLAFDRNGELFVHDSDMESDVGTAWYRPTRLYVASPGSEFGWRSGWAKWPDYYIDGLPAVLETGRGSPSGAVVYNHHMFPAKYHNSLFLADWSEGRILWVKHEQSGGGVTANSEVFLAGRPLNVTDLDVGPDGALYFTTGGRGTAGGLYRVSWTGDVPDAVRDLGKGISVAIRQPQIHSAWSRQQLARVQRDMKDDWGRLLEGVARSKENPPHYRTRALQLMQWFGPSPSDALLLDASRDSSAVLRARAAEMLGGRNGDAVRSRLVELLNDGDRTVTRRACESLLRGEHAVSFGDLANLLNSDDRFESFAARRLLERQPVANWRQAALDTESQRTFIQGSLALLIAEPTRDNGLAVVDGFVRRAAGFVSDREFIDMLRVVEVAVHRGGLGADDLPELRKQMTDEFPAGDPIMNREIVRLAIVTQASEAIPRAMAFLESDADEADKLHLAMHLRFLNEGWTGDQKLRLVEFLQQAKLREGGGSYEHYVINVLRDVGRTLNAEDAMETLARGDEWPDAAVGALYRMPKQLDAETLTVLRDLDQRLGDQREEETEPLKVGIVAVLARSGDAASMEYLREIWLRAPERRQAVAMGLAQQPDGENWSYLVRSLPLLEGAAAREVLARLAGVNQAPEDAQFYRQVILRGLSLQEGGGPQAIALLEHWSGEKLLDETAELEERLSAWQAWFAERYPDQPPAELPTADTEAKWTFDELLEHLTSDEGGAGSVERGEEVFAKALCIKCHRFGGRGESLGPDLTSISRRFTRKETLESVVYPSYVVSDQFAGKVVITTDGLSHAGITAPTPDGGLVVLKADGSKVNLAADQIEEIQPSKTSAMPSGLLDSLTLQEISDLFAYLGVVPASGRMARVKDSFK